MADLRPYVHEGGQIRLRDLPEVSAGPRATADSFGGAQARQLSELGQAVGMAGDAVTRIATIRNNRIEEYTARNLRSKFMDDFREYQKNIFETRKGEAAKDIEKETENWWADRHSEAASTLAGFRNKDIVAGFNAQMAGMRAQSMDAMQRYGLEQAENANMNSRNVENEKFLREGESTWLLNPDKQEEMRLLRHANIQANLKGQSPETVQFAMDQADREMYSRMADAYAAKSPRDALAYLDRENVQKAFTPAEMKGMQIHYSKEFIEAEQKQIVEAGRKKAVGILQEGGSRSDVYLMLVDEIGLEAADKAMASVDKWRGYSASEKEAASKIEEERKKKAKEEAEVLDKEMTVKAGKAGRAMGQDESNTLTDIRKKAYENWEEKYAKIIIESFDAERKGMQTDKAAAAIKRDEALGDELKAAENVATKMPSYPGMSPKDQAEWLDLGKKLSGGKKAEVNDDLYLKAIHDMSDGDLADIFADPDKRKDFVEQMGGASTAQYKEVAARIKAIKAGEQVKISTLDTDLNNVKREAMIAADAVGRNMSAKEEETYLRRIISHARNLYEMEMKRTGATDVKELPPQTRNRIQAQAVMQYEIDRTWPIPNETISAAEAWATARSVSGAPVLAASLQPELKKNYTGGMITAEPGAGGPILMETSIDPAKAPESVRTDQRTEGGVIMRDLVSGGWLLVTARGGYDYAADGSERMNLNPDETAPFTKLAKEKIDPMAPENIWATGHGMNQ